MADEATDVQDGEITLDDFNADEQDTAKAESSPAKEQSKAEPKEPEVAKDTKEEVQADDTATPPDVPTKDAKSDEAKAQAEEPEVEASEDKPLGKAEERKAQLNTEIRDLVAQRNTLKAEVEKANAEVYQPATEDELTEQGMTAIEAKVEAMRQEREMEKYNSQVADAQLTIGHESERVLNDFPQFNPESGPDVYDKELAEEAAELLASNLIIDPNTNQVIGSNVSPYQLYKTLARASGISAQKGQLRGQEDAQKQLANVDAPTSAAPPKEKVDPLMELWKSDD